MEDKQVDLKEWYTKEKEVRQTVSGSLQTGKLWIDEIQTTHQKTTMSKMFMVYCSHQLNHEKRKSV